MSSIQKIYEDLGAEFILPAGKIGERFKNIRAFIFDWDGVFNNAQKQAADASSSYNEVDSMGTNLLRFSYYLQHKKTPATAIISGEKNTSAFYFAQREHFNASYFKVLHKKKALEHFCHTHNITPKEVCFFFDDALDLDVAQEVGLRILISRKSTTLFTDYVKKNNLVDYVTASESGSFAVREACEMLMGSANLFDEVLMHRTKYDEIYRTFISQRNTPITHFFTLKDDVIIPAEGV